MDSTDITSLIMMGGLGVIVVTVMIITLRKIAHLTVLVNSRVTELITQTERASGLAGRLAERAEQLARDHQERREQAEARRSGE